MWCLPLLVAWIVADPNGVASVAERSVRSLIQATGLPQSARGRAIDEYRVGDIDRAVRFYTLSITLGGDSSEAYSDRAYLYSRLKKYEQSVSDASIALSKNPKNNSALRTRGYSLYRLGRLQDAERDLTSVIEREPDDVGAQIDLARCLFAMGREELALEVCDGAIAQSRAIAGIRGAFQLKAELLERAGRDHEAAAAREDGRIFEDSIDRLQD